MKPVRYQKNNQNEEGLALCTYPIITQGQGRKFMSFVISFLIPQRTSQTQRIFLLTISKDSLRTLSRINSDNSASNQRVPQGISVSQYTKYPQISYISANVIGYLKKLPIKLGIFLNVIKNLSERGISLDSTEIMLPQRAEHEMSRRYVTVLKVSSEY